MIKITMVNGNVITWNKDAYTDYVYDRKFFIVIQGEKWVGFYNLAHVFSIEVGVSKPIDVSEAELQGGAGR